MADLRTLTAQEPSGSDQTVILDLPNNPWRLKDAFEGTQIFGATGSGKTTGSGANLALALLHPEGGNCGGLVLAAKPDEAERWIEYGKTVNREEDIVVFSPNSGYRFNFLDYEFNRPEDSNADGRRLTHNIVSLFLSALGSGEGVVSNVDPYWNDALRELLTHAVDLADIGSAGVELPILAQIIRTAPQNRAEISSPTWRQSLCWNLLEKANKECERLAKAAPERLEDLEQTIAYWLNDFPNLAERTRSVIVSSFTSKAAGLLHSPLRRIFSAKTDWRDNPVRPIESHWGKVIVLDFPVKIYGETGRFAQILYKTIWQRATERRIESLNPRSRRFDKRQRPVFLWADEAQYFFTNEDLTFQQTARSSRTATVYLTQNLPSYHVALGSRNGTAATESLLGNLSTKIFHANGDPATNEWAERLFGKTIRQRPSESHNTGATANASSSYGSGPSIEPRVWASQFATLAKGGETCGFKVGSIIFQTGRAWEPTDLDKPSAETLHGASLAKSDRQHYTALSHEFNQFLGSSSWKSRTPQAVK